MNTPKTNKGKKVPSMVVVENATPDAKDQCQECGHTEQWHYGSELRWCNTQGCTCRAFK